MPVMSGARHQIDRKAKRRRSRREKNIFSVEALAVVAGKPHVLLSGDSFHQLQPRREAATRGLVSHQQRAQLF